MSELSLETYDFWRFIVSEWEDGASADAQSRQHEEAAQHGARSVRRGGGGINVEDQPNIDYNIDNAVEYILESQGLWCYYEYPIEWYRSEENLNYEPQGMKFEKNSRAKWGKPYTS